jgi:hypothetical protein
MRAIRELAAQCHGADTGLTAQCHTVAGVASPAGLAKHRRDMIPRWCQRHGEDSSLTRASALCQNIKCSGRRSGCGSGELTRASSETESCPRGRPALERGGVSPEGTSSPRARQSLTRGGIHPSSEVESRWYGGVPLERSGVSLEGCRGWSFWLAAEVVGAVGPCHRAVIVLGVICEL